ncbi:GIY-YIG nuclease family protein [Streptomyces triticirhizae]|uniref:GIY-YIG nuclease family protein n=1 Tax=Streptomyces triticirhizae TaxID=2483353 RepID=A0A3M2M7D5_9ACTN|nr:GIY-YIG nuclease family protein [Streptomyces triticirhizae]RMI44445.1 GIY-YIG nuclease family protein [Streptomyces triticirhizae]
MDEIDDRVSALIRGAEKQRTRWEAMRSGVIYLIGMDGSDRVKIGFTTGDPEKRLRQLQTGAPEPLRLLAVFSGKAAARAVRHLPNSWRVVRFGRFPE